MDTYGEKDVRFQVERNFGASYHQEKNMFRPYEGNYLTNEPYLAQIQNTHTQLETSQLSPNNDIGIQKKKMDTQTVLMMMLKMNW